MSKGVAIVIAGILFVGGMVVERYVGNSVKPTQLIPTMAYGYFEKDNVWNRMRVDEKGHVLCSKETQ